MSNAYNHFGPFGHGVIIWRAEKQIKFVINCERPK